MLQVTLTNTGAYFLISLKYCNHWSEVQITSSPVAIETNAKYLITHSVNFIKKTEMLKTELLFF